MTLDEAKKMEGVEFTYIFEDEDTVPAYVKKFDPEKGLTCLSLATETERGWAPSYAEVMEYDGTFCVFASADIASCLRTLEEIKRVGTWRTLEDPSIFVFEGCVFR